MSFHPNDVARRSRGAKIFVLVAFAWLSSGFYRAQVLRHAEYVMQSEENRLREVPLPAPRGIIYDRAGKVIAENLPGSEVQSDDELLDYARQYGSTVFHATCTCKMGPDTMAVVDDRLRVHGLQGLRVVDASVMPRIIRGHTHAPTVMIAERAADLLRADA